MKRSLRIASISPRKNEPHISSILSFCGKSWEPSLKPLAPLNLVQTFMYISYYSHTYSFSIQLQTLYFSHTHKTHHFVFGLLHLHHLFGRFDRWSRHEFPTLPSGDGWRTSLGWCWSSQQFWARCTRTCTSCLEKYVGWGILEEGNNHENKTL